MPSNDSIVVTSVHQVKHKRLNIAIAILEDSVKIQAQSFPQNLKFETLMELRDLFNKAAELAEARIAENSVTPQPVTTDPVAGPAEGPV